jgi:hypothetical protein
MFKVKVWIRGICHSYECEDVTWRTDHICIIIINKEKKEYIVIPMFHVDIMEINEFKDFEVNNV